MTDEGLSVVYEFSGFRLNPAERVLEQNGRAVPLTPKAFDLLVYLVERRGRLAEKNATMAALWPDTVVEEANLAFQISTLRRVLGDQRDGESLIQTVPTKGYRFVGQIDVRSAAHTTGAITPAPRLAGRSRPIVRWASSVVGGVIVIAGLLLWRTERLAPTPRAQPMQFEITLPPDIRHEAGVGAVSPSGEWFAFQASANGHPQLFLRNLASADLIRFSGSENAWSTPFWSPDSRSISFFDFAGRLKVVAVAGGSARVLTDARLLLPANERAAAEQLGGVPADDPGGLSVGGTWHGDVILFTWWGRLYRFNVSEGSASVLGTHPWKPGEKRFAAPQLLPDGNHFLISVVGDTALYLAALDAPGKKKLLDDAAFGKYADGHLFYTRGGALYARPFDPERLTAGPEMRIVTDADPSFVSVSDGGTVVYRRRGGSTSRLTWFDRQGAIVGTIGEAAHYNQVVLSPRADRATVALADEHENIDLWNVDLVSGVLSRLTTDPYDDTDPSWAPDEQALAFTSQRGGSRGVFVKDLRTAKEEPLLPSNERTMLDQWTPDGRFIVYRSARKPVGETTPWGARISVCAMPLESDRKPRVLLADVPYIVDEVHVSPDGRWVAFHTDESGRWEVYVATFPEFTSKRQVSIAGGVEPQWRGDGRELFYLGLDGSMMSVILETTPRFKASPPARLFTTNMAADVGVPQYGVTSDAHRFLGLQREPEGTRFVYLLNWNLDRSKDASGQ
jgi:eukaryotic-like serine/threonine-protein kinase